MTFLPASRGRYLSITACISGWYFAITRSAPSLILSSKWPAILRSDSSILVGPKKLYSRSELVDHGLHQRLVFCDHALGAFLDLVVEVAGNPAQRLLDLGRAEEVVFHPRNAVLLFHVTRDVVHRSVAVQHVELGLRRRFQLRDAAVARPLRDHTQTHLLEQDPRRPGIATT